MYEYERLMKSYHELSFEEVSCLPPKLDGLLVDKTIYLRDDLHPHEKNAILGEEIGHFFTTSGRVTDYRDMYQFKNEVKGRRAGFEMTMPLEKLIECCELGLKNVYEVAEHLELPEEYIWAALKHYEVKYGNTVIIDQCRIVFNPLSITKVQEGGTRRRWL